MRLCQARHCLLGKDSNKHYVGYRTSAVASSRNASLHAIAKKKEAAIASEQAGIRLGVALEPGLELLQQTVEVDGQERPVIVPLDIMQVLEMYLDLGQQDRDPYWARPWPSGVALAQVLVQQPQWVSGMTVCEVGAGLGLAGLAAAQAGAAEVTLMDREMLALQCAVLTAWAWGMPLSGPQHLLDSVQLLQQSLQDGGQLRHKQQITPSSCCVTAQVLDWHSPAISRRYDVLLLCDVLYEKFSVEPVGKLCTQLLNPGGRLMLADPTNRTQENRERFVSLLRDTGMPFVVEECYTTQVLNHDVLTDVSILNMRLAVGNDTVGVKRIGDFV